MGATKLGANIKVVGANITPLFYVGLPLTPASPSSPQSYHDATAQLILPTLPTIPRRCLRFQASLFTSVAKLASILGTIQEFAHPAAVSGTRQA